LRIGLGSFLCYGFNPDLSFFRNLGVDLSLRASGG